MDPNGGKGIPIFQRPKGIQFLQGKTAVSCVKNSDVGIGFRKHAWIKPHHHSSGTATCPPVINPTLLLHYCTLNSLSQRNPNFLCLDFFPRTKHFLFRYFVSLQVLSGIAWF